MAMVIRGYQPQNGDHVRIVHYSTPSGGVQERWIGQTGRCHWHDYNDWRALNIRFDQAFYDSSDERDEKLWAEIQEIAKSDSPHAGHFKSFKRDELGLVAGCTFSGHGELVLEKLEQ